MRNFLIGLAIKYNGDYFKIRKAIKNNETINNDFSFIKAITIVDENYPAKLKELKYPPFVLFYKGNIELLNDQIMAVVGSRKCDEYGICMTKDIVNKIKSDYTIVSGMAKGIDGIAHSYASKTIGVLGCGINYIYPYENLALFKKVEAEGLIISEYPDMVKPESYHFPFRNRIIAALGKGIIVTSAKMKSGTMLTVNEALSLNKDVYVVPYPLNDEYGDGCNYLIQQGANIILKDNISGVIEDFI